MPLWGKNDAASNSCIFTPARVNKAPTRANANAMFGNSTPDAFVANVAFGVFGADVTEVANTATDGKKLAHAGWQLRKKGTGPLTSITITSGGTGYANTDLIKVVPSAGGGANATGTIVTNANGTITAVTVTAYGKGFVKVNPTVQITNSTGGASAGANAVLVATAGGRAGRLHYECLVAMGTITGDAADDTFLTP